MGPSPFQMCSVAGPFAGLLPVYVLSCPQVGRGGETTLSARLSGVRAKTW
jgi:hypothetical protein